MNKYYKIILALMPLLLAGKLSAQQTLTAGPDKIVCPGVPTMIGPMTTDPSLCYKWEPAEYLSCDDCPNPQITLPDDIIKKQYTLFISNNELSISVTDKMEVRTGFGPMKFDKNHFRIVVGEEVLATLEKNEANDPITWSLVGDALGCSIDSNGKITGCNKYGKLKVKATKASDSSCSVEKELEVNHGVKDVHIVDADNDRRVAKNGETLFLIASPNCIVKAIPNDGEEFGDGSPEWFPFTDEVNPIPKGESSSSYAALENVTADFSAGDPTGEGPKTYVNKGGTTVQEINLAAFLSVLQQTEETLKAVAQFSKAGPPAAPKIVAKLNKGTTLLKGTRVEDFDSPALGWESNATFSIGGSFIGTVYHPTFTHNYTIGGYGVSTALGMTATWTGTIAGSLTRSDAIENSDKWLGSMSFSQALTLGVFFDVNVALGGVYEVKGGLSADATATFSVKYSESDPDNIAMVFELEPLKATFGLTLEKVTDPKKSENIFPKISYSLIDKKTYPVGKIPFQSYFDNL